MSEWDEAWEALVPPRRASGKPVHIGWLFAAVLGLMALTLVAVNWRHWTVPDDAIPVAGARDTQSAHFAPCGAGVRATCVVDGDTIWLHGEKIRIADINAPEVTDARCDYELDLGRKATARLVALLNAGAFSLESPEARDVDRYDRKLRVVMRGGRSVGALMVDEGLAEEWTGHRRDWCAGRG